MEAEAILPASVRLDRIRGRIAAAARRGGRRPEGVTLVGVSKTWPAAAVLPFFEAGLAVFGENRVQEAQGKSRELPAAIEWHLIGPLQSNKVRPALELFHTVHSLDRPKIAQAIEDEARELGITVRGFLEVNVGGEASKHGFPPDGLAAAARPFAAFTHLQIVGLMAIPPPADDPELSRPWFQKLRALRDELAAQPEWAGFPGWLSMGMSDDFEVAIEEGATHVRVGTALFGPRG